MQWMEVTRQFLVNLMTLNERFGRIEEQLTSFGTSLKDLTKEHYELGKKVAHIDGLLKGSANR